MQLKKDNKETVQDIYADYKKRTADHKAETERLQQILAEDKKRIENLNAKLNAVNGMTEEEYIATSKALENERLTMEMHDKQYKHFASGNRGFKDDADKQQFKNKLLRIYREDEAAFNAACDAKMQEIIAIIKEREERLKQFSELAGATETLLQPSNERQFYMQTIARHDTMKKSVQTLERTTTK